MGKNKPGPQAAGRTRRGWLAALCLSCLSLPAQTPVSPQAREKESALKILGEALGEISAKAYRKHSVPALCVMSVQALARKLDQPAASVSGAKPAPPELAALAAASDSAALAGGLDLLMRVCEEHQLPAGPIAAAELGINACCGAVDNHSRYLSSSDLELLQRRKTAAGTGIGLTLIEKKGRYFCYPLPGSPAETANIHAGDQLLKVDDAAVAGLSMEAVRDKFPGGVGTEVQVNLARRFGRSEVIAVKRQVFESPALLVETKNSTKVLRIRRFDANMVKLADAALGKVAPNALVILDLRGCYGGSLQDGFEFINLFMPKDSPMGSLQERDGSKAPIRCEKQGKHLDKNLVLLQDEQTASAAELTIACLVSRSGGHAVSQGRISYGKSYAQDQINLKGGGRLELSTAELQTAQGESWEGRGLQPTLETDGILRLGPAKPPEAP